MGHFIVGLPTSDAQCEAAASTCNAIFEEWLEKQGEDYWDEYDDETDPGDIEPETAASLREHLQEEPYPLPDGVSEDNLARLRVYGCRVVWSK